MKNAVSIKLHRCAKTFDNGTRVLEPIDLDIAQGETLVLLGPSGCGKTTTLRLIAGLEFPDAGGRVFFGSDDVTALPIEKRGVGMVFQSYALFPNMTVGQNIAYGLKIRKVSAEARAKKVGELIDMFHLQGLVDRRIDQLSGGQRQRVALARALAVEPRVLLLDEPLTALDAKLRESLRVEISRLLRSLHITVVYVTHDQGEAMSLGDRIVVMERGKISQIGTPREIYHKPANLFVADFIGTMNRIKGRMHNGWFEASGGRLPFQHGVSVQEVMFRPEDAEIVNADGDAHLHGKIVSVFFLGDHTRLIVDIGTEQPVIVETTRRTDWQIGAAVALRVESQAVLPVFGEIPS